MKRTKRQESWIIIYFLFYLFLFLITIYFSISFFYPKVIWIENKKIETNKLYEEKLELEKKWIWFWEFMRVSKNQENNNYTKEILKTIDKKFYNKHLLNIKNKNYKDFLNSKTNFFNSEENKKIQKERDSKIINILPYYSENYTWNKENESLSNFKFVSYVESILETFNLSNSNWIWIKDVFVVEEYAPSNGITSSLENNIYYIPLRLSLIWPKKGIIDFLHFIENVWKINIDEKNNLLINNDKYFETIYTKTILAWKENQLTYDYNIYKNQIIDIEKIKIPKYIDNSNEYRQDKTLVNFIKNSRQRNQMMEIEVDLLFYVRWYPNYKIEEHINKTIEIYEKILKKVSLSLTKIWKDNYKYLKIRSYKTYLITIKKEIFELRKNMKNVEKIEQAFKKSIKFRNTFTNIEKLIN